MKLLLVLSISMLAFGCIPVATTASYRLITVTDPPKCAYIERTQIRTQRLKTGQGLDSEIVTEGRKERELFWCCESMCRKVTYMDSESKK